MYALMKFMTLAIFLTLFFVYADMILNIELKLFFAIFLLFSQLIFHVVHYLLNFLFVEFVTMMNVIFLNHLNFDIENINYFDLRKTFVLLTLYF
jgi:hypothetical protein